MLAVSPMSIAMPVAAAANPIELPSASHGVTESALRSPVDASAA